MSEVNNDVEKKEENSVNVNVFPSLEGRLVLVNVGTEKIPASEGDLEIIRESLSKMLESNGVRCLLYVANHDVNIKII